MGLILAAKCSCGYYKEDLKEGRGASLFQYAPAFCKNCKDVVGVLTQKPVEKTNWKKQVKLLGYEDIEPQCQRCQNSVEVYGVMEVVETAPNGMTIKKLSNETFECPKCCKKELRFDEAGAWH